MQKQTKKLVKLTCRRSKNKNKKYQTKQRRNIKQLVKELKWLIGRFTRKERINLLIEKSFYSQKEIHLFYAFISETSNKYV